MVSICIRCDAESRQRLCPNPPLTEDGDDAELVEYWYVQHNNTIRPYLEFGVTILQLILMLKVMHGKQVTIHICI